MLALSVRIPGKNGHDRDGFDAFCDHLLIRDSSNGEVSWHLSHSWPIHGQ